VIYPQRDNSSGECTKGDNSVHVSGAFHRAALSACNFRRSSSYIVHASLVEVIGARFFNRA
jgi:hypothetical protein